MIRKAGARRRIDAVVRKLESSILIDPRQRQYRVGTIEPVLIDLGREFAANNFERCGQLIAVIEFLITRETELHRRDPERWRRRHEDAA